MSTRYNTGNPIESTDVRDMSDNAKNFDEMVNSSELTFTDRLGVERLTYDGFIKQYGINPASFDFQSGGTLISGDNNKGVLWPIPSGGDGQYYIWRGEYQKLIPAESTPTSTGGISNSSWLPIGDITLRSELDSLMWKASGDIRGWGAKCDGITVDDSAIASAIEDTNGQITIAGPTLVSATVLLSNLSEPCVSFIKNGKLIATKTSFTFANGTRGILTFKDCSDPIAYMPRITGAKLDKATAPEPWEDGDAGIEYLNCSGVCRTVQPNLDSFKSWGIIHVGVDSCVVTAPIIRNCLTQSGIGCAGVKQAIISDPDIKMVGLYGVELETKALNERSKVSGGIVYKSQKAVSCINNTLNAVVTGLTAEECHAGFSSQSTSGSNLDQGTVFSGNTIKNVKFGVELVNSNKDLVISNSHRNTKHVFYTRTRSYDFIAKVVGSTGYTLDHPVSANLTVGMPIELESGEVVTIASVGAQVIDPILGAMVPFTTTPELAQDDARKAFCREVNLLADTAFCVMYGGRFNGIRGNHISSVNTAILSFGDHVDLGFDDNSYENVTTILTQGSAGNIVNSAINISPGCVSGGLTPAISNSSKFNTAFTYTDTHTLGSITGLPKHRITTNIGKIIRIECVLDDNVAATGSIVLKVNDVDTIVSFTGKPRKGVASLNYDSTGSLLVQLIDTVGDVSGSGYSVKLYGAYVR